MRKLVPIALVVAVSVTGCGRLDHSAAPGAGSSSPSVDARKIAIYEAVVRSLAEFPTERTVSIYDRVCADAGAAGGAKDCSSVFSQDEQAALLRALSDWPSVEFVSRTEQLEKDIFNGKGGMLVRLGPITEDGDKVDVPASEYCGGLCGRGGVWVVEQGSGGWSVTGSVGGTWIS
jgi:hypothetical protein